MASGVHALLACTLRPKATLDGALERTWRTGKQASSEESSLSR